MLLKYFIGGDINRNNFFLGYYGLPLLMFVITIQIYTAVVLGKCWIIAEKLDPTIISKNR